MDLSNVNILATTAIIASAGTLVYSLKSLPSLIYNKIKQRVVYNVRIYQYDELFEMFETWLSHNYSKSYRDVEAQHQVQNDMFLVRKTFPNGNAYTDWETQQLNSRVIYKQEDNTFILNYGGKRILVMKSKEKIEKAQALKEIYFRKYSLSGIRAKRHINEILNEAVEFHKQKEHRDTIKVYTNSSYGDWHSGISVKVKPIDKTILNRSKKETILDDLKEFLESEEWYMETSIPYKRGYCFYGPPGTGKTTLALAIANYTKRNVFCLNLNCIEDDARIPMAFRSISENSILLIEDIDKVFSGRENVKEGSKITFSSLLNCMDGAFYRHGLITIITTNHIEKLDEALIRTGRIDLKMEVPKPSDVEISKYLSVFFNEEMIVHGHFDIKMSDVQEICIANKLCPALAKQQIIDKIIN